MRLLVLAAIAAVALADVSHLASYQYNTPASSYGVPQGSVTERQFNILPTSPPQSLNLPAFEHQDFNALNPLPGLSISTTAAPPLDSGLVSTTTAPSVDAGLISSTPAPSVVGGGSLDLNAQLPNFGSGLTYTTSAPSISFNAGGLQNIPQFAGFGGGIVSSTPAPSVDVTSGSQESLNINPQLSNFGFNAFSTPAPSLFSSTVAPTFSTLAPNFGLNQGFGLGSSYSFPGFGLGGYSTAAPITLGSGGLGPINPVLFGNDAAVNSVNVHGITSGGSLSDAFGVSGSGAVSAGTLPQPQQVSRHLYFYAAPEDPEPARTRVNVAPVPPPKKNIRVIFIKAPTPPAPAPISIAAPPQDEDKTIVYVLVKKPEDTQNIEIQTPPPTAPPKPEVYFIKYKTPQEAEHAIAQVQSGTAEGSGPSIPADTISGGGLLGSISRESLVTTGLPIIDGGFSTTTSSPLFIGGGFSGAFQNGGFIGNLDADISQNLIPSGIQTSSLYSTASPQNLVPSGIDTSSLYSTPSPLLSSLSTGEGLTGSTTEFPLLPHVTYGPPIYKKKRSS